MKKRSGWDQRDQQDQRERCFGPGRTFIDYYSTLVPSLWFPDAVAGVWYMRLQIVPVPVSVPVSF